MNRLFPVEFWMCAYGQKSNNTYILFVKNCAITAGYIYAPAPCPFARKLVIIKQWMEGFSKKELKSLVKALLNGFWQFLVLLPEFF